MFICEKDEHCIDCPKNYPDEKCEHWIEVEPVKHGHWEDGFCTICHALNPTCQLNENTLEYEEIHLNRCPHCGAKMDEVNK